MAPAIHPSTYLLVMALSDALGREVVLDDHGECVLAFDGDVDLVVGQTAQPGILSLRSAVTGVGALLPGELLQQALAFNYSYIPPGYALGLDVDCNQLLLFALVVVESTPRDAFLRLVAGFLDLVPALREKCAVPADKWAQAPWAGIGVRA